MKRHVDASLDSLSRGDSILYLSRTPTAVPLGLYPLFVSEECSRQPDPENDLPFARGMMQLVVGVVRPGRLRPCSSEPPLAVGVSRILHESESQPSLLRTTRLTTAMQLFGHSQKGWYMNPGQVTCRQVAQHDKLHFICVRSPQKALEATGERALQ